jgi:uncharacterized membrane protein (Fun14 family)
MTQDVRYDDRSAPPRRAPVKEFFGHVAHMPPWHRKMLVLAGVLAIAGLIGEASRQVTKAPATDVQPPVNASGDPAPRSGFVSESTPAPTASPAEEVAPQPTFLERMSPWATRVGVGFIGGFVIGWAFRAFLKTMALVTAAGVAIIWALSHFNVLNLDMDAAESRLKSGTSWVSSKAEQLKDSATALIPSSASSVFGMFLGFRRR